MQTRDDAKASESFLDNKAQGDMSISYRSPEVVGVLPDENDFEAAVDELLVSGFDRQQISILANWPSWSEGSNGVRHIPTLSELEDDPGTHLGVFISSASRTEFEAAAAGIPIYALGIGGYVAVVASGGSLALAFAALLLVGGAGSSLGGFLAHTIAGHHRDAIAAQIAQGGLLLWVQARSLDQEARAVQVLKGHRGYHVHVHHIDRAWGIEDVPFYDAQPDPFLEQRPPRKRAGRVPS